jgi:hypothetical protein
MNERRVQHSLVMGALCGVVGLGVGIVVRVNATGGGYEAFPLYASLAALLTGTAAWWLLVALPAAYRSLRGALAGALAGLVAHYVCWYLMILGSNVCYWLWGACVGSLGEPPVDPLYGLLGAAALSLGSLLLFGWLTVPAGGVLGFILARRQSI